MTNDLVHQLAERGLQARLAQLLEPSVASRSLQSEDGFAIGTLKGPVRQENQDRAIIVQISQHGRSRRTSLIALVCDGMGGMEKGGEAASLAASAFVASMISDDRYDPHARLERATWTANAAVFNRLHGLGGTTLTAVCIETHVAMLAHVGDSRAYIRSSTGEMLQISRDDTLDGLLKRNDSDDKHADGRGLLQFVGIGKDLSPHILPIDIPAGALLLLTSDGAHSLERRTFQDICRQAPAHGDLMRRLLFMAEAVGARDNATIVSLDYSRIQPVPDFGSGITVNVWTPSKRLELWLYGDRTESDVTPHRYPGGVSPGDTRKKAVKEGGRKKNALPNLTPERQAVKEPTISPIDAPQLRIYLDQDDSKPDETT